MTTPTTSPGGINPLNVVVFGASWCKPGDPLYIESEALGGALAAAGLRVVNGGYGGTMEGSAKGAASVLGGEAEGVLVPSLFTARDPTGNAFLTSHTDTASLMTRIDYLVRCADAFVVLPGTLGTLTELMAVLNVAALGPLGGYPAPLILAFREPWKAVVDACGAALRLPAEHVGLVRFVEGWEEAVRAVREWKEGKRGAGAGASASGGAGAWPAPTRTE
jgi:uncharacterized protein (TIGR00725 family)